MSGLVERLWAVEAFLAGPGAIRTNSNARTVSEAADEITRLTARVAELEGQVSYAQGLADFWMAKARKLAAQISDAELVRAKP